MKKLISALLTSALLIVMISFAVSFLTGWNAAYVVTGISVLSIGVSFMAPETGVAFLAVTKTELAVKELLKQFDDLNDEFLKRIPQRNEAVKHDTIRMTDIGADPDVLIDNAVYPIAVADREDNDVVLSLRKLDTINTRVTEDEIHALHYNKHSSVRDRHKIALIKKYLELSLFSLAPSGNTNNTPVLKTTGAVVGNRKRLTIADLVSLKTACDNLNISLENRVLSLCPDHVADLLLVEQAFKDQYHKIMDGKVLPMYGFWMTEKNFRNQFTHDTLTKLAFGGAPGANHRDASTLINTSVAVRARGSAEMFLREAKNDPEHRETVVGFRLWGICVPTKNVGFGAIVSAADA